MVETYDDVHRFAAKIMLSKARLRGTSTKHRISELDERINMQPKRPNAVLAKNNLAILSLPRYLAALLATQLAKLGATGVDMRAHCSNATVAAPF
jgi:hypothetical protein